MACLSTRRNRRSDAMTYLPEQLLPLEISSRPVTSHRFGAGPTGNFTGYVHLLCGLFTQEKGYGELLRRSLTSQGRRKTVCRRRKCSQVPGDVTFPRTVFQPSMFSAKINSKYSLSLTTKFSFIFLNFEL